MGEFFAELIVRTLTAVAIGRATVCRKKLPHYLLGCFAIFLSGLCLLWRYIYRPVPMERFQTIQISYSNCLAEGPRDDRRIILKSGDKDYVLHDWLWKKRSKEDEVLAALKRSSDAVVWLPTSEDHNVRGLETATFRIDPSVGAEWDKSNRNALLWIFALFFGLGSFLIVVVRFSKTGFDDETSQ